MKMHFRAFQASFAVATNCDFRTAQNLSLELHNTNVELHMRRCVTFAHEETIAERSILSIKSFSLVTSE